MIQQPISIMTGKPVLPDMAQDVVDFHHKFKIGYEGKPRLLDEKTASFRGARGLEEVHEWIDAHATSDLEGCLDAIVDEIYILLGTAHLQGFTPDRIAEAWRRVHTANMQKELCSPTNPGKYGALGDKLDIVKPSGWKAPDLSDLVQ